MTWLLIVSWASTAIACAAMVRSILTVRSLIRTNARLIEINRQLVAHNRTLVLRMPAEWREVSQQEYARAMIGDLP